MNELKVGIVLTADGSQQVSEVKKSKEAVDGLGESTRKLNAEAIALGASQNAMAAQMNAEYRQLTANAGVWEAAQKQTMDAVSANNAAKNAAMLAKKSAGEAALKIQKDADAALNAANDTVVRLQGSYDKLGGKLVALQADYAALNRAAIALPGDADIGLLRANITRQIADTEAAIKKHAEALLVDNAAIAANSVEHKVNAVAMREPLVMIRELSNGNMTKFTGSLSIFAQAMGALPYLFTPVGAAIAAITAATIGLEIAFSKGAEESNKMNRALVLTSDYAGQTRASMESMAQGIESSTKLTIGQAKMVATEVAASGKISAAAYDEVTRLVGMYSDATGIAADKSAEHIIKIFSDPAKGAAELNSTMHFLSVSELDRINTLQKTGDMVGAQTVLADAYTKKLQEQENELGTLASGWITAKKAASEYLDVLMSMGAKQTNQQMQSGLQNQLSILQNQPNPMAWDLSVADSAYAAMVKMMPEQQRLLEIEQTKFQIAQQQSIIDGQHNKSVSDSAAAAKNQAAAAANELAQTITGKKEIGRLEGEIRTLLVAQNGLSGAALAMNQQAIAIDQKKLENAQKSPATTAYNADIKAMRDLLDQARGKVEDLTRAEVKLLEIQSGPNWATYTEQRKNQIAIDALAASAEERLQEAKKKTAQEDKAYAASIEWINKARDTSHEAMQKEIDKINEHTAAIGLSKSAIEALAAARDQDTIKLMEHTVQQIADTLAAANAYNAAATIDMQKMDTAALVSYLEQKVQELADFKDRATALNAESERQATYETAKLAADEWKHAAKSISTDITNAIVDGGKSARDVLLSLFKNLVLRPRVEAVVNAGMNAVGMGTSATANAAGGASGMSGLAGMVSTSMAEMGAGYTAASTAGMTSAAMSGASLSAQIGFLAGNIGTALAAIPVWGWIAAGVTAVIATHLGGETRSGGAYSVDASGKAVLQGGPSGGEIAATQTQAAIAAAPAAINALLAKYGSAAQVSGFVAGLESSNNGKGGAYAGGTINGTQFGQTYNTRTMQSLTPQDALTTMGQDLNASVVMALQAANLPGAAGKYFSQLGAIKMPTDAAGVAEINKILGFVTTGLQQVQAAAEKQPEMWAAIMGSLTAFQQTGESTTDVAIRMANAFSALHEITPQTTQTSYELYNQQQSSLQGLIGTFDGSVAATNSMAGAMQNFAGQAQALTNQLASDRATINGQMQSQVEMLKTSIMDAQQKSNFYVDKANSIEAQIKAEADPTKIANEIKDWLSAQSSAWQNMSLDQQKAVSPSWQAETQALNQLAIDKIGVTLDQIKQDTGKDMPQMIADKIGAIMDAWLEKQAPLIAAQQRASDTMQAAVNTPLKVTATVDVHVDTPATVYTGVSA